MFTIKTAPILALALAGAYLAASDKQVQAEPQTRLDAVMITRITVGDQDVQCGLWVGPTTVQPVAPFAASGNWLQQLTIYLLNRTNKSISYAQVGIGFPETGDGHTVPRSVFRASLGRIPPSNAFFGSGKPMEQDAALKPLSWGPGETFTVHLAEFYDRLSNQVEQRGLSIENVTQAFIYIGPFYFEDGMIWFGGLFKVPDPDRKGKYISLDRNYFPGNPYRNWPTWQGAKR
jgi:hypothetical protein